MTTGSFGSLDDLNQWLAARHMTGFWNSPRASDEVKPHLWKWDEISRGLLGAAELVPMEMVAMRTIQLHNPGLGVGMTRTLHFSVQCLMPGERTKAHRNLVNESRFVLKAPAEAGFVVDGEAFPMEPGDLITTPNWSWHDHYNLGDEPAIWLDGMDTRLVNTLGKGLNERYEEEHQPVVRPAGYAERTLGRTRAGVAPSALPEPALRQAQGERAAHGEPVEPHAQPERLASTAPYRYRWQDTYSTLVTLKESEVEGDPCDGIHLTLTHPVNGGPTFPTYACEVSLLGARVKGRSHRHNSTTIYHAFRGEGVTIVESERLEWSEGDVFVVPPWSWHEHENPSRQDSILYSITDRPAAAALGLYREELE